MPNHTVSGNVDTMMRAVDNAAIRSAIGVGTTDTLTVANIIATGAISSIPRLTISSDFLILPNSSSVGIAFLAGPFLSGVGTTDSVQLRNNANTAAVRLAVDADGILAQRNGVNAQAFRVYNAYYGTTADEWLEIDWKTTGGTVKIGANKGATGGARALALSIEGTPVFGLSSNNSASSAWWSIQRNGHLFCNPDNTYDIGASGANRPKTIYAGTSMSSPTFVSSGSLSAFGSNTQVAGTLHVGYTGSASASLYAPSNGVLLIGNVTASDFGRLCLGGTTSAFPAIARSGANIGIVLGDGSGYTSLLCKNAVQNPGVGTTVTPASIGDLVTETTSNTSVTLKLKGSDGTVRSVALTLA